MTTLLTHTETQPQRGQDGNNNSETTMEPIFIPISDMTQEQLESFLAEAHRTKLEMIRIVTMKPIMIVIAVLALLAMPTPAKACSGWLDCAFGWTDRTEVRAAAETEQARIDAQAAAEVARIEAEQAERVRQADAEVERVKQQQFATNAQRDIAIAQIEQQAAQYKASIAALTSERLAGIQANADSQIAALQAQAEIATAGITETGRTERYRIVGGWTFAIVAIVLCGLLLALYAQRHQQRPVIMVTGRQHTQLPWLNDGNEIEIIEVKHAINRHNSR